MINASANIERDFGQDLNYVVTANSKNVIGNIINYFKSGLHSICLIGSYGTGKSSFIIAMQNCMNGISSGNDILLKDPTQFNNFNQFHFTNIVGEYSSFYDLLQRSICPDTILNDKNLYKVLKSCYENIQKDNKFWVICIDEFGKVLEHAANNNPEREMYSIQKFCEFVNGSDKNILFLSTLHQGFGAYSQKLTLEQVQEWNKIKGRICEIAFKEPVEQLLNIVAKQISINKSIVQSDTIENLYNLAIESKFITKDLHNDVVKSLYPLDIFSAYILTLANQRYGQNERTLFMFLNAIGKEALSEFVPSDAQTFNVAKVYDYIVYNFDSYLNEPNADSTKFSAIQLAIERIDSYDLGEIREKAISLVKVIGLLNVFATGAVKINASVLSVYASLAMNIKDASDILDKLCKFQIIRYASYKNSYILYEGSDIDIEFELSRAASECSKPDNYIDDIRNAFEAKVAIANAYYFKTGTPRYFEYQLTNSPLTKVAKGEVDGYLNLLFVKNSDLEQTEQTLQEIKNVPIAYCLYQNTDDIINHIFEIAKLNWVKKSAIEDDFDRVANREINNLLAHEKFVLSKIVSDSIFSNKVKWYFNGEVISDIKNQFDLSKFLSTISDTIYPKVPIFRNEMLNKHKLNSVMCKARLELLEHLISNSYEENIGFPEDKYPPEKTLYYAMFKETGIHIADGPLWKFAEEPTEESFKILWDVCCEFLQSTLEKQRNITELAKILSESPFGMKQGFIDCWIPAFLIIKKGEYALYQEDRFVPEFNRPVLELMLRCPSDFYIKSFSTQGVKRKFFDKYREVLRMKNTDLNSDSFIETIKPFLVFYNRLNDYAKSTKDVSSIARKFRDVISVATDPEMTFFEKLPEALGFKAVSDDQDFEDIGSFVERLQEAIDDLKSCYDDFIDRIESKILNCLAIKDKDFDSYKSKIDNKFKSVKSDLMPQNIRKFHNRLVGKIKERNTWIESVCFTVLNKPLEKIKDSEKTFLLETLSDNLSQLEDYVDMHKYQDEEVVRLSITENKTGSTIKQVILPTNQIEEMENLKSDLKKVLKGDKNVKLVALMKLIKTEL